MKLKSLSNIKLHKLSVLYGHAGSGKSTVINSLPGKVLIIDTDRGLASVSPDDRFDVAECYSWEDVLEAFGLIKNYDSVAIDHFTNVQELCYHYIMNKYNVSQMQIQHYGEASPLLKHLVDLLVSASYEGKNVLVLAQETSINVEEEGGDDDVPKIICPNLSPSLRSYLQASARVILHTQRESKKTFENGKKVVEEVYAAQVSGNPVMVLKVTRAPGGEALPKKVKNPTWDKIVALVEGKKETKKKETKGDK